MQFIYRGEFSKGLDCQTTMSVTFNGREPSDVTDAPAINWFNGHPDYEAVVPVPEPEAPVTRRIMAAAPSPKKPAKKRAKAKK